jgi:hypothetical protein
MAYLGCTVEMEMARDYLLPGTVPVPLVLDLGFINLQYYGTEPSYWLLTCVELWFSLEVVRNRCTVDSCRQAQQQQTVHHSSYDQVQDHTKLNIDGGKTSRGAAFIF